MIRVASVLLLTIAATTCGGTGNKTASPGPTEPVAPPEAKTNGDLVVGTDACTTDADCARGECCHPKTCVARDRSPQCEGVACTLDCRGGTMDCGGGCVCHEGRCAARLLGFSPKLIDRQAGQSLKPE
ncbi:MAG: hypothetical protein PHU25_18125 [Deltaproteobacteria bacterium]|nr:hypothetical protein [Deltaproteobacteria bacterium]